MRRGTRGRSWHIEDHSLLCVFPVSGAGSALCSALIRFCGVFGSGVGQSHVLLEPVESALPFHVAWVMAMHVALRRDATEDTSTGASHHLSPNVSPPRIEAQALWAWPHVLTTRLWWNGISKVTVSEIPKKQHERVERTAS